MSPGGGQRLQVDGKFFRRGDARWIIKGVCYGPFERALENSDVVRRDLMTMKEWHFNAVRIYEVPRLSFFELCRDIGLDVFVTLPWEKDTDFLRAESRNRVLDKIRALVRDMADVKSLEGYFVGNEIAANLVRWMGPAAVNGFLEEMIDAIRAIDATRLLAYGNFPTTEYLRPRNADFTAFNVYLEDRSRYRAYLRRLHHVANDRPLVIAEYGLDSLRHGEAKQAETLAWLAAESYEQGAAGGFCFSFTDEWHNGGKMVEDWAFGLTHRDRSEKPAAVELRRTLAMLASPGFRPGSEPRISVIVCTYNGHATLGACLESLRKSRYDDFEVLVVDDGSKPGLDRIVAAWPECRYLRMEHGGLSAARNFGAREATGEILAFTDDDCEVDADWLVHLARALSADQFDCCGGPNLPPSVKGATAHCIALAPGNPMHVMLDDERAEHLPGCNLAVRKSAFLAIGGFREQYRAAGDDVDFCWRLRRAGFSLGFAPNAFVWHHRRKNLWAFCRQQIGYGKAEALLAADHPERFSAVGGARWEGSVYLPGAISPPRRPLIYHGHFGNEPFQRSEGAESEADLWWTQPPRSLLWAAWTVALMALAASRTLFWFPALAMLGLSIAVAAVSARRARLPQGVPTWRARTILTFLYWFPPLARAFARWLGSPPVVTSAPIVRQERAFWNQGGLEREALLEKLQSEIVGVTATEWGPWDLALPASRGAALRLMSATERHPNQGRLIRVALRAYVRPISRMLYYIAGTVALILALRGEWLWILVPLALAGGLCWWLRVDAKRRINRWMERITVLAKSLDMEPHAETGAE